MPGVPRVLPQPAVVKVARTLRAPVRPEGAH
ncbi:hypothetical protein CSUB01_11650, partial [Colletotrichum sublineola]